MARYTFDVLGAEQVVYMYEVELPDGLTREEAVKLCEQAWEEGTAEMVGSESGDTIDTDFYKESVQLADEV